jgi:ribose transport system substrate-binding protein
MSRPSNALRLLAATGAVALLLSACGSSSTSASSSSAPATDTAAASSPAASASGSAPAGAPAWCGSKQITLGLTDGFGGNSWRLVTTAAAKDEIAKCPSVTDFTYADGQGDTQKAISDINGLVAKGVNALVVFPDAGNAILPALQAAHTAGVTTVPYRVNPGGTDGTDYDVWVGADFTTDGTNWGNWIVKNLPNGGNVLFLSGPAGNSQGVTEGKALHAVLDPTGKYKFIGADPFEVTNWDPAKTQQVLTAAIAKYPKIDVIVSDFGPSLVGALPEFEKAGRSIPALVTSDGNVLSCFYEDHKAKNPDFKMTTVATGNDNARLAVDWAVALASGGTPPSSKQFEAPIFEDSVSGQPNPVTCKKDLPGDVYLSAQMSGADQAKLLK